MISTKRKAVVPTPLETYYDAGFIPPFISVKPMAALLGMAPDSLMSRVREYERGLDVGIPAPLRIGQTRRVVFSFDAIQAWLGSGQDHCVEFQERGAELQERIRGL